MVSNLKKWSNRSEVFILILISVSFTLPHRYSNILIIALALVWILQGGFKTKWQILKKDRMLQFILAFYSLYVLSLFYTQNWPEGFSELEKKLAWFVFPIVIGTSTLPLNKKTLDKILLFFILGCCFSGLFFLLVASREYLESGTTTQFFYHDFSSPFQLHAVYYALYVSFCLVIIFYWLTDRWTALSNNVRCLAIFGFVFLIFLLLLTTSKIVIFVFLFFLLVQIIRLARTSTGTKGVAIPVMVFLLVITIMTAYKVDFIKDRIEEAFFKNDFTVLAKDRLTYEDKMALTGLNVRLLFWKVGMKHTVLEGKTLFGSSPGDAQDFLDRHYRDYNLSPNWFTGYNMHNQYVDLFVQLGLMGLVLFLFLITGFFKVSVLTENRIYFWFLLIFFLCCLTESMLERNKGIVFFAFFNSLFLFKNVKLKNTESNKSLEA